MRFLISYEQGLSPTSLRSSTSGHDTDAFPPFNPQTQVSLVVSSVSFTAKGCCSGPLVPCHCHVSFAGPLSFFLFHDLTPLRNTGELFCSLNFFIVSSRLDSGFASLAGIAQRWCCVLPMAPLYPVTDDSLSDHLIEEASARCSNFKVTVFLFLINVL